MAILNSIVSWFNIKRMSQIDLFRRYPADVQMEVLNRLLKKASDTEFGNKYSFDSIKSYDDFQKTVPIQDYDKLKIWVEKLRQGKDDVLWPGKVKWFAKSSGTTSDKSKFIPVTKEALEECHFRGGKDVIALYTESFPESNLLKGKSLALGGSLQVSQFSSDSYYGDLSALIIRNLPFWAEFLRTPNLQIALMDEWESKLEHMAKETSSSNVTNIAGVPSWMLVLLNKVQEVNQGKSIFEIWPNLELFIHGGVSFNPYRDQFKRVLNNPGMNYMETYNASEGFFAIQDDLSQNDMLLMLDYGVFYEFIPLENLHDEKPLALSIGDVEIGRNYAIVISTNGGLWRYLIGDTVKFTSLNPHKIVITGRTRHFINAFGEELIIENSDHAIQIACEKTHARIREYTAAPVYMEGDAKGAHEWIIEFEKAPDNHGYFMEVLDNALKSLNSDYEAKRYKNMTLSFPKYHIAPEGTFYNWLRRKGKLGGQNKVPRLANNRYYIDEILEIMNSNRP